MQFQKIHAKESSSVASFLPGWSGKIGLGSVKSQRNVREFFLSQYLATLYGAQPFQAEPIRVDVVTVFQ